jgi:restriction system protein
MGRRRRKDAVDQWVELPWRFSAWAAVIAFALLNVVPGMFKGVAAQAFGPVFRLLAWAALLGFGLIAIVSFLRTRSPETKLASEGARSVRPTPTETSSRLDEEWDRDLLRHREREPRPDDAKPESWSPDVLRRMEWKRLEYVAAAYYEALGFRTEPIGWGPDGGVDVKLFRGDLPDPVSVVQCKAYNGKRVPVGEVRDLLGVMTNAKVKTGVFLTTSSFSRDAIEFAKGNFIALVDGDSLLAKIRALPPETQSALLRVATEGEWTTPSCASCGIKLVLRKGRRGSFWGCRNYPRCKNKLHVSSSTSI